MRRTWLLSGIALAALGCAGAKGKTLVVPDEMRRATQSEVKDKDKVAAPQKYVVRMAEGGRVWEMELPEQSGGYEMRVPIASEGLAHTEGLTAADEELLTDAARDAAARADPEGKTPASPKKLDPKEKAKKKSYLGSLARVNGLYGQKQYELALIELVELERDYPADARVQSMKGSLYVKLGKNRLAKEAWEKALQLNPDDLGVAEALHNLASSEE